MKQLQVLWIIQMAPLAAFLMIQLLPRSAKRVAPIIAIACAFLAAACSLKLFSLNLDGTDLPRQYVYEWLQVADHSLWPSVSIDHYVLSVGFLVDKLNLLMISVVTVITFFVHVFSFYYMAEDKSRARYFGFLSFFAFSMTGLVLSTNLLQTFIFWELVGLTSYLLIGFWIEKQSAGTAARKAFVINRLADLGFYLGILVLFMLTGTLNFTDLNHEFLKQVLPASTLTMIGILVFMGVMGKSAQFPFHTWLPDAMEGPTPVSALIHSATMVAAGVFLLARAFNLFSASETTLLFILVIGTLTALVGASLATIQRDIKKIMAYSTVSQLGLMVMVIGAGSTVAGMFHLTTHAFFKSLLFLTSGAFIHHFHTNDIWEIGARGGKHDKIAVAALSIGLFSLCGIFPFAGFFSKDLILEVLREHHLFFYAAAILVSFLTVYYSFRMFFVILFSKEKKAAHGPTDGHAKSHASGASLEICRVLPLASLAAISLVMGFLGTSWLGSRLLLWLGGHETHLNMEILITTLILIVSGAALAYFLFKNPEAAEVRLTQGRGLVKTILERKFFIDDLYDFLTHQVGLGIAAAFAWFDRRVTKEIMVNGTAYRILDLGKISSKFQDGLLQDYLSWAIGVGILVAFWLIKSNSGVL